MADRCSIFPFRAIVPPAGSETSFNPGAPMKLWLMGTSPRECDAQFMKSRFLDFALLLVKIGNSLFIAFSYSFA